MKRNRHNKLISASCSVIMAVGVVSNFGMTALAAGDITVNGTNFPDENFRNWILSQSYGEDGILTQDEISSVQNIYLANKNISDLKGIEHFKELRTLRCDNNKLTTLNVSNNTELISLNCDGNSLTDLNVSGCTKLTDLTCNFNSLTSLDLSNSTVLENLTCFNNQLTSLKTNSSVLTGILCDNNELTEIDLSKDTGLKTLWCTSNPLESLDLTNNPALEVLLCDMNYFEDIDLSNNTELKRLILKNLMLNSLDVSNNKKLKYLKCENCGLKDLDVSLNPNLTEIYCKGNQIKKLYLSQSPDSYFACSSDNKVEKIVLTSSDWESRIEWDLNDSDLSKTTATANFTCTKDANYKISKPMTVNVTIIDATCEKDGSINIEASLPKEQSRTEVTLTETRTFKGDSATGHAWGDWKVTKKPTLTSEGEETRVCNNDPSHKQTRKISKLTPTATPVPTVTTAPATVTVKPTGTVTTEPKPTVIEPTVTKPAVTKPAAPSVAAPTGIEPSVTPADSKEQILAFVKRIYTYVLDREPEAEGAAFWSDELYSFRRTGAEVGLGFIFSDEFTGRGLSDGDYVTVLYRTFFGRDPEEGGFNFWTGALKDGTLDRNAVANGFIYSQEWADTCATYGIRSGGSIAPSVEIAPSDATYAFVERMYTTAMNRESDAEGSKFWANELSNFRFTGEQVGVMFFLSDEMNGFGLSDSEFVTRLYKTFMDREPEEGGFNFWVGYLNDGNPRENVVLGFTRSDEFVNKCIEARILPY